MSLRFASLGSGSEGNALIVQVGETVVMMDCGFGLAATETRLARAGLMPGDLDAILASVTDCPLGSELLGQIRRARHQLLTFCDFAGKVDATNNVSERALRPRGQASSSEK